MSQAARDTQARFATTRWSLIEGICCESPLRRQDAAESLCSRYWPAVYGYLRRKGHPREEAEEITQGFFADAILGRAERGVFAVADRHRGRLRSLLLACLKNYVIDRVRSTRRAAIASSAFAIEEMHLPSGASLAADDADLAFDRRWAALTLEEALRRTREHFELAGKHMHWRVFEARILNPAVHGTNPPPLSQAVRDLGFETSADAAAAVQYVKRRVDLILREVLQETAGREGLAQEHADFLAVLT